MKKVFEFGKIDYRQNGVKDCLVTIEMELKEGKNGLIFSASANVWNARKSDIYMGGQCLDSIYNEFKGQISNSPLFKKIMGIWERNHLNDMNAGTPKQTAFLENLKKGGWKYSYESACESLKAAGLYEVAHPTKKGEMYKYGHAWLYRPILENDLVEIQKLLS